MKSGDALRVLAELSSSQWGMVTSAQAGRLGLTRLDLSRLAEAGHLTRLAHGVYRDAGAPGDEFEDLRAAWLGTNPGRFAEERLGEPAAEVVISGASSARLHGIGDLPADRHEFSSPDRRQTQRTEIRYRQRSLDARDVTIVAGLPVTTIELTIADLVEARTDLSIVADALRDASGRRRIDVVRLQALLAPLAARQGMRKGDGAALLARLLEIAGLDLDSLAREIATSPLGARVAAKYVGALGEDGVEKLLGTPEMRQTMRAISDSIGASLARALAPQLEQFNASSRTTLATLLNATGFDDSARRLSEQLVSSEAVLSLSRSWAKTFSQSVVFDPEMIATVRAARQATTDE